MARTLACPLPLQIILAAASRVPLDPHQVASSSPRLQRPRRGRGDQLDDLQRQRRLHGQGLSFTVPINLAVEVAAQLRADGQVRRAQIDALNSRK